MLDEGPILELGKLPIPGDAPCGVDPAEDTNYLFIEKEIYKLDSLEAQHEARQRNEDPQPNWFEIEQRGERLFREKTKSLELAEYYSMALFKRHGYAGLSAALGLVLELVNNHWAGLFPERARQRKARIESLGDHFILDGNHEWFKHHPPSPDDYDDLDHAIQRAEALRDAGTALLPENKPDLTKFISGLKGFASQRPKGASQSGTEASTPLADGSLAGGAGQGTPFTPMEVKDLSTANSAILAAAKFIRDADLQNPLSYAVVRAVRWAAVQLPTPGEARTTILPPEGYKETLGILSDLASKSKWEGLLRTAEGAFRLEPLWLDLQYHLCTAMSQLGAAFDPARKAILSLTGALIRRLGNGVFELRFKGGDPLCGGATRLWIEAECGAAGPRAGGGSVSNANGKLTEAYDQARNLAGSGKLAEGLQALHDGLGGCSQRRDRLLWRLRIAQLCADAQKYQLAVPLLEECQSDIQRHHVDEWEPGLAAEVAHALYRCRKALITGEKAPSPESRQRLDADYAWLARLDPPLALAIEPPNN